MSKNHQIFDYKEKRALIETLLIIAGILTAFNKDIVITFPILILFIIASLSYIIRIAIMDKKIQSKLKEYNFLFSISVAVGFSGLLVVIGAPVFVLYGLFIGIPLAIILYGLLIVILFWILYKE